MEARVICMNEHAEHISSKEYKRIIKVLSPCMEGYLFMLDLDNDRYCISQNALERFDIPECEFDNASEGLKRFINGEDIGLVEADIARIRSGESDCHNIQYRWLNKNREPVWISCSGRVVYDFENNNKLLIGCVAEIGLKQKADNISGLLGEASLRAYFEEISGERLKGVMLRIGIDGFKRINENRGMACGDMLIKKTAGCISAALSAGQLVFKIIADEFIIVDISDKSAEDMLELFRKIQDNINEFIEENKYDVFYTVSGGILDLNVVHNQSYHNIMKLSEYALNEAKERGRNRAYSYNKKDYMSFVRERNIINMMRQSVNQGFTGFVTYYQPIVSEVTGKIYAAETLLRYVMDDGTMISPAEFIPLLEESDLIIPVGKWIIDRAFEACKTIQKSIPDFKITVNLSYVQILKSDALRAIKESIAKYGINPESVVVELTESGFMESSEQFIGFCEGLKESGIMLALDDFGTGYSNFHYLYNIRPNTIKIDRSFTAKAMDNDYEYSLLQHMIDMTHNINLKLCMEGIETDDELNKVRKMGPDYIQGYYFGRPCPLKEFLEKFVP